MHLNIADSWKNILQPEFDKPYFTNLANFVKSAYTKHPCFPEEKAIFSAFNACAFEDLKVVIIGQDPYHGIGQANGLCFSVPDGIKHPPSLINIYKELATDIQKPIPTSGDLSHWAAQGVLLLNATLTVRAHEAGSHQKQGWEQFTDAVIATISEQKKDVVFLLWGKFAEKKGSIVDASKHHVLTTVHPSPLGAWRGWFGSKHFSKTNMILTQLGETAINW